MSGVNGLTSAQIKKIKDWNPPGPSSAAEYLQPAGVSPDERFKIASDLLQPGTPPVIAWQLATHLGIPQASDPKQYGRWNWALPDKVTVPATPNPLSVTRPSLYPNATQRTQTPSSVINNIPLVPVDLGFRTTTPTQGSSTTTTLTPPAAQGVDGTQFMGGMLGFDAPAASYTLPYTSTATQPRPATTPAETNWGGSGVYVPPAPFGRYPDGMPFKSQADADAWILSGLQARADPAWGQGARNTISGSFIPGFDPNAGYNPPGYKGP